MRQHNAPVWSSILEIKLKTSHFEPFLKIYQMAPTSIKSHFNPKTCLSTFPPLFYSSPSSPSLSPLWHKKAWMQQEGCSSLLVELISLIDHRLLTADAHTPGFMTPFRLKRFLYSQAPCFPLSEKENVLSYFFEVSHGGWALYMSYPRKQRT